MSRSGRNKFIRATRHLKSTQIDERLQMLNEIPTNSTNSIYTDLDVTPTPVEVDIQIPGDVSRAADFDQDDSGTDTTGLFDDDGTILTIEPPGDTSAILGPMISQWYAWGNFTRIGYVRESDRRVVTLATIDGEIADYNEGESGNSLKTGISNSLTQEQVEWFRDQDKRTYYAFYPGPPSGGSDGSGRYPGLIIATSKDVYSTGKRIDQRRDPVDIRQPWALPGLFGNFGNFLTKILKGPEEFFPKGTLVGNALQDALKGGVKHSAEYNTLLPVYLGLSILTGQKLEIPVSPTAAKNISKKINASALNDVLRINSPTPTTAKETIKPSSGKSSNVIQDKLGWGAQGGLNFNYNTQTKQLEITSNKTLRTTSGGETVTTAKEFGGMATSPGKITSFSDIPTPTKQQLYDTSTKLISAVSQRLGGPGLDPTLPIDIQLKGMADKYDSNDVSRIAVELGTKIISTTTQGAASNIVALRKVLVDNGIVPKSDIEKIGGAYGQVSTTVNIDYNDLPKDVQKVISSKAQLTQNYDPQGQILTESRKRIIREVKKPYQDKEEKKEKLKGYRPRVIGIPGTPIDNPMKKIECPSSFKPMEERMWGKYEKRQNARASQERLNQVGEYVLEGGLFWEFLNKRENARKSKNILEFYGELPDKKIVRRENVRNDSILFLVDENGKTETLLQSEYNEMMDERINKQLFAKYLEEQESKRDPLFKRVSQKINPAFDYPNRPSKDGYPDTPPPEMVNGYHPDLVDGKSVANRFNRLDPISAEAMPPTGNPEIDAKVQKARRIKRIVKGA